MKQTKYYVLFLLLLSGCAREEIQFELHKPDRIAPDPLTLWIPEGSNSLDFWLYDRLDTSAAPRLHQIKWLSDSVIGLDTFKVLDLDLDSFNMPLKGLFLLQSDVKLMHRYYKGYRYTLFSLRTSGFNKDTVLEKEYGIKPHNNLYWYQDPYQLVEVNGEERFQVQFGIDSAWQDAETLKYSRIKAQEGKGVLEIEWMELLSNQIQFDTVRHFVLKRN
ncbi:MAG: hypothetical protein EP332_08475 [Bacteroidetes bacterium]|nr:MAG: hypothetical protein EP332_08475 [Bacteroidota bacterium]